LLIEHGNHVIGLGFRLKYECLNLLFLKLAFPHN